MTPEQVAAKARKSLASYCINECKSYCCRKGYLVLLKKQFSKVMNGKEQEYADKVKKVGDSFSLFMGTPDMPCPSLREDFTCGIHKSSLRPLACREFPLFIRDNTIYLSNRCPAARDGLLYPYIARLVKMGLKYHKNEEMLDMMNVIQRI